MSHHDRRGPDASGEDIRTLTLPPGLADVASPPSDRGGRSGAEEHADDAGMAVELTAAGVGPVILPMSLARLHHRKDVTYRELTDAPTIPVVLVWPQDLSEEDEATVQQFVGIVRGRSANSGRDTPPSKDQEGKKKKQPQKQQPKAPQRRGGKGPKGAKAASASKNARRRRPR